MKNIRIKLKTYGLKITELANYLNLSRPTLYKYIESYEKSEINDIPKGILGLLDYIYSTPYIGKNNIISYILSNPYIMKEDTTVEKTEATEVVDALSKYLQKHNADSFKVVFIKELLAKCNYESLLKLILQNKDLLNKRQLNEETRASLKDLQNHINQWFDNKLTNGGK